ncbi:NAD(FAD)-utilizing dehydrogenase [Paramagnetospirillum magnetotacticum MS-1]|uniref:NAD(FAD)-utilizing dehydrogenase n=1 Tax=Paramagnetospirillum magnetotacticum MS-1 TaxID=272627 RepID=A0A0C2YKH5_PARME|nr:TIGR03862 family flavoprotein [Paramagnetospirillum magnetotacticum]KIM00285.1 NAD(FAD)-utilizing dehydrogenase [Paramagnetospirillum magnetotacticum MS-1]
MSAIVIGAGPAGLMAAEVMARQEMAVEIFDAMASPGRKFLLAGKGGLNLTHSEPLDRFTARYGAASAFMAPLLGRFGPEQLRAWAGELGVETFVGSSGRVFPAEMKAAPLLRAWMRRLRALGIVLHTRRRWLGWSADNRLRFMGPDGEEEVEAELCVLALGGASWPRLGSDGGWVPILAAKGVEIIPMKSANCGFDLDWSDAFAERFAGGRTGTVELSFDGQRRRGEITITATGIEGGAVYAMSAHLRDALAEAGQVEALLDLMPDWSPDRVAAALGRPRGSRSLSTFLKKALPLGPMALALLREILPAETLSHPSALAAAVKALPLRLKRPRPLDESISTAGGIALSELDGNLMLKALPGVFAAGEMLDWEAPTGGYLLTGCFSTGYEAGQGALRHCNSV